jgi:hypothetical protein
MEGMIPNTTHVTVLGLCFLLTMVALILRLGPAQASIPLLITVCYMPMGQEFNVGGLSFQYLRVLLLVGWCRALLLRETSALKFNKLDWIFLWWVAATLVLGTLANPTTERFISRGGEVYNALGAYYLFRCWIRDLDDLICLLRFLAVMIVPLAVSMVVEKFTTHNIFSVFGGVPETTGIRDGRLRCQGAFRHPILAGTYGATMVPMFVGLWFSAERQRLRAALGALSGIVVTIAAASSGALLAMLSAICALALWPLRYRMRYLRRVLVVSIIGMTFLMNAPVWYIFARLSVITGGTGWYRSYIIDQAIRHFDEWWLVGSTYTAHWAPGGEVVVGDPNNMDIINHYVAEGLGGGLVKLGLFITLIIMCFRTVGRWSSKALLTSSPIQRLIWSVGVCLFAHCVSFLSVSYFDHLIVMWYWLLAVFSMLADELAVVQSAPFPEPDPCQVPEPSQPSIVSH